jgi:hypothetical protein
MSRAGARPRKLGLTTVNVLSGRAAAHVGIKSCQREGAQPRKASGCASAQDGLDVAGVSRNRASAAEPTGRRKAVYADH